MQFLISIDPGDRNFPATPEQTLLEAAQAAGLVFPYGCRDGACGSCKGQILSGEVELSPYSASALSAAERASGLTLFCRAHPRSDMRIRPRSVSLEGDFPVKRLPCRVESIERVADDVIVLKVKLPASEPFRFKAGQYIDFLLADGLRRSFSIANAPLDAAHLELHIRRIEGGSFTTHVFEQMKPRDILRFEGPLGSFWLREQTDRPVILVAGGTGFAPIKGLVEDAVARKLTRSFTLYWGARDRAGLYLDALAQTWARDVPGFTYVPVLSDAEHDPEWSGRRGLVHQAVLDDLADLSGHEVYACGAPAMIDAARGAFTTERGLPDDAFYCDAFTFASDAAS